MTNRTEVPAELGRVIDAHVARGRTARQEGRLPDAEAAYLEAWRCIPEPKLDYDFYPQVLARALVTFFRDTRQFAKADEWLATMREAYGGGFNESVEFLGATVALEAGDEDEAFAIFDKLVKEFGGRPFQGEDNRKHLAFYRSRSKRK